MPLVPEAASLHIPAVDLQLLETDSGRAQIKELIAAAMKSFGCFYLVNHGCDVEHLFDYSKKMFDLPMEAKEAVPTNQVRAGYSNMAYAKEELEQMHRTQIAGCGMSQKRGPFNGHVEFFRFLFNEDTAFDSNGMNIWPDEKTHSTLAGFRDFVRTYVSQVDTVAKQIISIYTEILGLSPGALDCEFEASQSDMRLAHYLASEKPTFGLKAHLDNTFLTFIPQSDRAGLEICTDSGYWFRPKPMPGSIMVNSGYLLRRWTNHHWESMLHRVVNEINEDRYACVTFYYPSRNTKIACLPTCTSDADPPQYKPIACGDFLHEWVHGEDGVPRAMRSLTEQQQAASQLDAARRQA